MYAQKKKEKKYQFHSSLNEEDHIFDRHLFKYCLLIWITLPWQQTESANQHASFSMRKLEE